MDHTEAAGRIIMQQTRKQHMLPGIFMSFWLKIPPTSKRDEQIVHFAVYQYGDETVASFIPIDHFPAPGDLPPRHHRGDLILPHSRMLFIRRKLNRLGIKRIEGGISEREVPVGKVLTH